MVEIARNNMTPTDSAPRIRLTRSLSPPNKEAMSLASYALPLQSRKHLSPPARYSPYLQGPRLPTSLVDDDEFGLKRLRITSRSVTPPNHTLPPMKTVRPAPVRAHSNFDSRPAPPSSRKGHRRTQSLTALPTSYGFMFHAPPPTSSNSSSPQGTFNPGTIRPTPPSSTEAAIAAAQRASKRMSLPALGSTGGTGPTRNHRSNGHGRTSLSSSMQSRNRFLTSTLQEEEEPISPTNLKSNEGKGRATPRTSVPSIPSLLSSAPLSPTRMVTPPRDESSSTVPRRSSSGGSGGQGNYGVHGAKVHYHHHGGNQATPSPLGRMIMVNPSIAAHLKRGGSVNVRSVDGAKTFRMFLPPHARA